MDIIKQIKELINEVGTSSILRERLLLVSEQLELMRQEIETLKKENAELVSNNDKLTKQLIEKSVSEEFVEYNGVLFRKTGHGYSGIAYCPVCKIPLGASNKRTNLWCSKCTFRTFIRFSDIPGIIAKL